MSAELHKGLHNLKIVKIQSGIHMREFDHDNSLTEFLTPYMNKDDYKKYAEELQLVLDESDSDLLAQYINRISSILKDSVQDKKDSIASLESLTNSVNELTQENVSLKRQLLAFSKFDSVDEFIRTIILDKVANIIAGSNSASIHEFLNCLDIYSAYSDKNKAAK